MVIIENEHICNKNTGNGHIIYLNRDKWYLKKDNNTDRTEINFCPWCGKEL